MSRKIRRVEYKLRALIEYAKQKGVETKDLTDEEFELFEAGPTPFERDCVPMLKKNSCFVCRTITGWLDRQHLVYVCKKECMNVIDKRYEEGEEIPPHPVSKAFEDMF